jgi:hypothetical protein
MFRQYFKYFKKTWFSFDYIGAWLLQAMCWLNVLDGRAIWVCAAASLYFFIAFPIIIFSRSDFKN